MMHTNVDMEGPDGPVSASGSGLAYVTFTEEASLIILITIAEAAFLG